MVGIWEILEGILEDCNFESCLPRAGQMGGGFYYRVERQGATFLSFWTHDRQYKIYSHSDEEISIVRQEGGGESVAVDIDLRDSDSVEKIRRIILDKAMI